MKHNKITPEEQARLNKEFGRRIAEWMYQDVKNSSFEGLKLIVPGY